MAKIFLILSLFAALLLACNASKKSGVAPDATLISYKKTPCRGTCPVFNMEIKQNGDAIFNGTKNTEKIGKYTKKLTKSELKSLVKDFKTANFFDFKDEYTSKITDLPSTYVGFIYKGKTKNIHDYHGAPKALKDLELKLDAIANGSGWTRIEDK
jgi:Domain of unknown function (DUF6438)